ncbi:hypothetical protein IWQ62_005209 [Dispira parvispora]|uniref:NTF2-domain-containing protein n=1 Tax=Dispira parvispora TaxID=1520584 RepID=A0A9W8E4Q4_9FUNG|nr:hypothetical protein IWQ62_005209 [Dispira parvispora]
MTSTTSNINAAVEQPSANHKPRKVPTQEVGWMFVEAYYTTLSKNTTHLHRYYKKQSSLIYGVEGKPVKPCFGQEEIHAKIVEANFRDCKVLVSNVDSIPSMNGSILVQVIGELSNDNGPSQKFTQTFLLAEQPNGYYVLNDIFRYINDDLEAEEEEGAEVTKSAAADQVAPEVKEAAPAVPEAKPQVVEETAPAQEVPVVKPTAEAPVKAAEPTPQPTPAPVESTPAPKPAAATTDAAKPAAGQTAWKNTTAWVAKPATAAAEPSEPVKSTPAAPQESKPKETPAPAPVPAAPKTWANLAANNPDKWGSNVAEVKGTVASAAPVAAPASAQRPTGPATKPEKRDTAGFGGRRGDRNDEFTIFVKGVKDEVTSKALREVFGALGPIRGLDIVQSRSIAYVDFASVEPYRRALDQHKFVVNGQTIFAEEKHNRRPGGGFRGGNPSGGSHRRGSPTHNTRDFNQQGSGFSRRGGVGSGRNGNPKPSRGPGASDK